MRNNKQGSGVESGKEHLTIAQLAAAPRCERRVKAVFSYINGDNSMKILAIIIAAAAFNLFSAASAIGGVNVNEKGNSVLCKGSSCGWLKPACGKEGGTYTEGSGGTGKCNFPSVGERGFTAVPQGDQPRARRLER